MNTIASIAVCSIMTAADFKYFYYVSTFGKSYGTVAEYSTSDPTSSRYTLSWSRSSMLTQLIPPPLKLTCSSTGLRPRWRRWTEMNPLRSNGNNTIIDDSILTDDIDGEPRVPILSQEPGKMYHSELSPSPVPLKELWLSRPKLSSSSSRNS